jgi:hypothetical protein
MKKKRLTVLIYTSKKALYIVYTNKNLTPHKGTIEMTFVCVFK